MKGASLLKGKLRGVKSNYKSDVDWLEKVRKDALTPGSPTASKSYRTLSIAERYMSGKRR